MYDFYDFATAVTVEVNWFPCPIELVSFTEVFRL